MDYILVHFLLVNKKLKLRNIKLYLIEYQNWHIVLSMQLKIIFASCKFFQNTLLYFLKNGVTK